MLELLSSSGFAYALIAGLVAADGVFPAIPGETALIGGALLASDGELSLAAVIAAGILGGWVGDNVSFLLGARLGRPLAGALSRGERARRRLAWAQEQLEERGGEMIVSIRFVPVGRTASTFMCGLLAMPWRRFAFFDAVAVIAWTTYAAVLGYMAGRTLGIGGPAVIAIAIAIAVVLGVLGELTHQLLRAWRARRHAGSSGGEPVGDGPSLLIGGRRERPQDLPDALPEEEMAGLDEPGPDLG
jgi:membrane protein DedA with SNARE-associated domain